MKDGVDTSCNAVVAPERRLDDELANTEEPRETKGLCDAIETTTGEKDSPVVSAERVLMGVSSIGLASGEEVEDWSSVEEVWLLGAVRALVDFWLSMEVDLADDKPFVACLKS